MTRVLIIEDEDVIRKQLSHLLERHSYQVTGASNLEDAIALYPESFDVILADIRLPGRDGTEILNYCEQVPVIMMTSYASVRSAVDSMKIGAAEYISKPFDHDELLKTIARSLRENRVSKQNAAMRKDLDRLYADAEMTSLNAEMQQSLTALKELAAEELFVYLQGERGTGKELLARLCHAHSERCNGPLVFADLPMYEAAELEESLFGSPRSHQRHSSGLMQAAHGGTLVIRSIGELSLVQQSRLAAMLLEAGKNRRPPDARLIVLARDSLSSAVKANFLHPVLASQFRENVFASVPLRERRCDINHLSEQYLQVFVKRYRKRRIIFSEKAKHALNAYQWPGNLNELKNVIERAVLMAEADEIEPVHLGINVVDEHATQGGAGLSLDSYFRYFVLNFEDRLTETELASKLGISRKALWERRQKMDLLRRA